MMGKVCAVLQTSSGPNTPAVPHSSHSCSLHHLSGPKDTAAGPSGLGVLDVDNIPLLRHIQAAWQLCPHQRHSIRQEAA